MQSLKDLGRASELYGEVDAGAVDVVLDNVQRAFWQWYHRNQYEHVFEKEVGFWFVKKTIRLTVSDLRPVFVKLFGAPPAGVQ